MKFGVHGWFDGEDSCEPPEPDKRWLTIGLEDDEFCIVVQRKENGAYNEQTTSERETRAELIAEALNEYWEEEIS